MKRRNGVKLGLKTRGRERATKRERNVFNLKRDGEKKEFREKGRERVIEK